MPVFECQGCVSLFCTAVITCNDDEIPDADDLACLNPHRNPCMRPVWRRLGVVV